MPDESDFFSPGMSDRDLAARLIRMGVIPPMNLDLVDSEKIEEITSDLPTVYACRYTVTDMQGQELKLDCYDLEPEGLNRQFLQELSGHKFNSFPERHVLPEYSPDAWKGFLLRDFSGIDRKAVLARFRHWGIPLESSRLKSGFGVGNPELNERRAEEMLRKNQTDLLSRLVRMGVIEPLDLDRVSIAQADGIIKSLPALTESEIIWKGDHDYERKRFVNLAEFRISRPADFTPPSLGEMDEGVTDEDLHPSRYGGYHHFDDSAYDNELRGPNVRAGAHTLHMQESVFLDRHEGVEDKLIHRRENITGGYAWLDYFRQGKNEALPSGHTNALRNAFKNWGIPVKRGYWELGFAKDVKTNIKEAKLIFYKALFSKLANAGIIPMMPKKDWYSMDVPKAEAAAAKIPLLPEQDTPGEWLEFFKQKAPESSMEIVQMEARFLEAGVVFDEKLILAAFPNSGGSGKTKGFRSMKDFTIDDYKKMISRLTTSGRMDRISSEEYRNLTLEDARDYVRGYDEPATDKQKNALTFMASEARVSITEQEISQLTRQEASLLIDRAPRVDFPTDAPENPMTESTRKELKRMIDNEEIPQIPYARFSRLSEEEARAKIDLVYSRRPISEKQANFIREALKTGPFPTKIVKELFNRSTISPAEVGKMNQLQASRLIGSLPATEKQIEAVKQLVEDKRIPAPDHYDLTSAEAREILDKAFSQRNPLNPDGPATKRQKETLMELYNNHQLPDSITPNKINSMTFEAASELIDESPASSSQKDLIGRFVHEGTLDHIPREEFANMTRGTASLLIDVATGKRPKADLVDFYGADHPATERQIKVLKELQEKGKIPEIPANITREAASQLITDVSNGEPISPQQLAILDRKIAENKLPFLSDEEKAKLTQGDFTRLLKESKKHEAPDKEALSAGSREHGKSKAKEKEAAGMRR